MLRQVICLPMGRKYSTSSCTCGFLLWISGIPLVQFPSSMISYQPSDEQESGPQFTFLSTSRTAGPVKKCGFFIQYRPDSMRPAARCRFPVQSGLTNSCPRRISALHCQMVQTIIDSVKFLPFFFQISTNLSTLISSWKIVVDKHGRRCPQDRTGVNWIKPLCTGKVLWPRFYWQSFLLCVSILQLRVVGWHMQDTLWRADRA